MAHRPEGEAVCTLDGPAWWSALLVCWPATAAFPDGYAELYELRDPATLSDAERDAALARMRDEVAFWGGAEEAGVDAERQRPATTPPRAATVVHDELLAVQDGPIAGVLIDADRHWAVARVVELALADLGIATPPPAPRGPLGRLRAALRRG